MKVTFTLRAPHLLTGRSAFPFLIALLFCLPAFGQGFTPEEEIGNLTDIKWKPAAELLPVFSAEQTRMSVALSPANVAADEKALYNAYQRLLTYVQDDIQAGKPVDETILASYKKVLIEAETDPALKSMPDGLLATYVPGLVESLSVAIKPTPSN